MHEQAPVNRRAATIAWQLAMEHNSIGRTMASRTKGEGYPIWKRRLYRLFYSIIYDLVIDGPTELEEELIQMLEPFETSPSLPTEKKGGSLD